MFYKLRDLVEHHNPKGEKTTKLLIEHGKEEINSNGGFHMVLF